MSGDYTGEWDEVIDFQRNKALNGTDEIIDTNDCPRRMEWVDRMNSRWKAFVTQYGLGYVMSLVVTITLEVNDTNRRK